MGFSVVQSSLRGLACQDHLSDRVEVVEQSYAFEAIGLRPIVAGQAVEDLVPVQDVIENAGIQSCMLISLPGERPRQSWCGSATCFAPRGL